MSIDMEQSDEQLVIMYREGATDALETLLVRHADSIYNFVFRLVGNREEAQDITQETSVKAWKNIDRFDVAVKWKTWVYAIARNTAIDHLRKKRSLTFSDTELTSGENPAIDNQKDEGPLPDKLAMQIEDNVLLEQAITRLSPLYREVLYLYYYEDMTLQEIATLSGKPIDTIKSQHRRGMRLLGDILRALIPDAHAPNYQG
jgi:RNA polymerase sigma-70 factor, ECF subfamily